MINLIDACNDNYDAALDNALAEIDIAFEEGKLPIIIAIKDLKLDNVCEAVFLIGYLKNYLDNGVYFQNCERVFGIFFLAVSAKKKLK